MTGGGAPVGVNARLRGALGMGILGLSLCGIAAGIAGLTWQTPQQAVVAAVSIAIGWKVFGR